MHYKVVLSALALADLDEIFYYIAYELRAMETSKAQLSRIEKEILSLEWMPERYRSYDREPWRSRGVHIVAVDHYCILYVPEKENMTVTILRVVYGGRDLDKLLNEYTS